jgi:hypothetical protein
VLIIFEILSTTVAGVVQSKSFSAKAIVGPEDNDDVIPKIEKNPNNFFI